LNKERGEEILSPLSYFFQSQATVSGHIFPPTYPIGFLVSGMDNIAELKARGIHKLIS